MAVCETHGCRAYPDNVAYIIDLPNRKSFSPDASYYTRPGAQMRFLPQPPDFAAEVRSDGDYGAAAKQRIADKRTDYFAAGTRMVWDVEMLGADVVRADLADSPTKPTVFRRGELAHAEPAVPGWDLPVDELFE